MEIDKITKEDIIKYLDSLVGTNALSKMIRNRLVRILNHCNSIQIFVSMTHNQLLGTAKQLGMCGGTDLGKITYSAFDSLVYHIKEMRLSIKKDEENKVLEQKKMDLEIAKENPTFTTEQIKGLAAFMELGKAKSVDLKKIKSIFDCFEF